MSIFSYMYIVPDSSVGRSPNLLYEYLHEETDIIHGPLYQKQLRHLCIILFWKLMLYLYIYFWLFSQPLGLKFLISQFAVGLSKQDEVEVYLKTGKFLTFIFCLVQIYFFLLFISLFLFILFYFFKSSKSFTQI